VSPRPQATHFKSTPGLTRAPQVWPSSLEARAAAAPARFPSPGKWPPLRYSSPSARRVWPSSASRPRRSRPKQSPPFVQNGGMTAVSSQASGAQRRLRGGCESETRAAPAAKVGRHNQGTGRCRGSISWMARRAQRAGCEQGKGHPSRFRCSLAAEI
jgi:hypothetical protein